MNNLKNFLRRFTLLFFISSLILFALFAIVYNFKSAAMIAPLFALLISSFINAHFFRSLANEEMVINASNMKGQKSLNDYYEEIQNYLKSQAYSLERKEDVEIYHPRIRQRIMGGDVIIKKSTYEIEIEGPKSVIIQLKSITDLEKIYL